MKQSIFRLLPLFFLLASLFPTKSFSGPTNPDEPFDPAKMILDHIYDSHEWHLWGNVSIPLPVILFHEGNGFQVFMSSKFKHLTKPYNNYMYDHVSQKIVYVDEFGVDELGEKIYSINTDESNKLWDFSITKNVVSLFFSFLVLCLLLISVARTYLRDPNTPPKGLQAFLEPLIIFVRDDIAKSAIGEQSYKKYLPFLLTIFFFIAFNNLLGLIPVFPGGANLTGNIAVAMVMAAIVFIITTLSGTKYYWKHIFAMPGVPKPVLLILTPIEIIGVFLKPFVLMIRLFANITAGHIIILSFFSLIFIFGDLMGPVAGYGVSVASVLFVLFMMTLEILVAFLQAYVFTLLSAMYFGMALEQH